MLSQMGKLFDPQGIFFRFFVNSVYLAKFAIVRKDRDKKDRNLLLKSENCGLRC